MGKEYGKNFGSILVQDQNVNLKDIIIDLKPIDMEAVAIVGQRPFVSYRGNRSVYNLSASPAAAGGTLIEGIKHIPGVQADGDKLTLYGFSNLVVSVYGQLLRLSQDDINAYLATVSVNDVETVELVRNPGPEYGAKVDAVLNIV